MKFDALIVLGSNRNQVKWREQCGRVREYERVYGRCRRGELACDQSSLVPSRTLMVTCTLAKIALSGTGINTLEPSWMSRAADRVG